jgi:FdhE protein
MRPGIWDSRIERARELASAHPFASEGLRFYERLAGFQRSLYSEILGASGPLKMPRTPGMLRQEFDVFLLLPRFAPFLSLIERIAPSPLAQAARELGKQGSSRWQEVLMQFWEGGVGAPTKLAPAEMLLSWSFLQPYAEYLADHSAWVAPIGTPPVCPLCGGKPQAGALRPEGDGGKRSLICALCALEWSYRRLVCPACGEEDVHKLAVYTVKEFSHVRVEACDACRTYIKTVDLTKDGRAVPVVDDLATLPLDLWATEHGYVKLQANVLGI